MEFPIREKPIDPIRKKIWNKLTKEKKDDEFTQKFYQRTDLYIKIASILISIMMAIVTLVQVGVI